MFFTAAKQFWFLCIPSVLPVWSLVLGACLLLAGRRRACTAFTLVAALLLLGLGVVPSYIWMGRSLEHRFDDLPKPARADGILVLGGGDEDIYRLHTALMLARRYPDAKVMFSGGCGDLLENVRCEEARKARDFMLGQGLAPARLMLEGHSRDTVENIRFSKALVQPHLGQTWILVTSAYHLPRAIAVAARQQWPMFPWPANHLTPSHGTTGWMDVPRNLRSFDFLLHEQIGLMAYRWSGRGT